MPLTDDPDERRVAVAYALRDLERSLGQLAAALAHERRQWVCVEGCEEATQAIQQACAAYGAINLGMDDLPGKSVVCLGVIGVPTEVVALAESVNAAKARLKAVCAPLQRVRMRIPIDSAAGPQTRALPLIRVILRRLQRSDLNLLAAYRRIPILGARPCSVVYTRARTRSVYRKTVEQIMALLESSDAPKAMADRARLSALPGAETHLALVREHYENTRANVVYEALDRRGRGRVQVAAELPLLFALRHNATPPLVRFPTPTSHADVEPARRRRSMLEAVPLLASLPVYRYCRPR